MTTALQHPSYALEAAYGARNYAPLPVMLERGEGVWLFDTAGRRYLDMMSAYSAVSFGHSHPKLVAALVEQAGRLTLTSRAFHNTELGPFLADVCRITRMDRALPMNTGAEAVETAIKAARKWARDVKGLSPDVAEIIVFENNFHGRTTTIVGFSSHDQYRYGFGPFAAGFRRIPFGDADALRAAIGPNTDAIFVVDVGYHKIAVTEAAKLGIPVIGVVDTNHSPEGIDYVIPGNDDSSKAVALYVRGVADAILEGRANAVQEVVEAARGGDDFVEVQEG